MGGNSCQVDLREVVCECVGWINLAQNRIQWQSYVNIGIEPLGFLKA
jgi:hypothetical protein